MQLVLTGPRHPTTRLQLTPIRLVRAGKTQTTPTYSPTENYKPETDAGQNVLLSAKPYIGVAKPDAGECKTVGS